MPTLPAQGTDPWYAPFLAYLAASLNTDGSVKAIGPAGATPRSDGTKEVASGLRFSAVAFGVVGDNNNATATTNSTSLNNCIAAAAAAGPGAIVEYDWLGVAYCNGGHAINSRIGYEGRLFGGTLKLANSRPAGTHVMQTASFASLTQTIAGAGAGEYEFWLDKLAIDGNKANNATGGCGVAIYGYGYWTGVNAIINCHQSGLYSEYNDVGEPINTGVGSAHQRGCHLGKTMLINSDCATIPAANTRASQGRGAIGGAQFTFFGPGDSDAEAFEIFRDGTPAGSGFQLADMDFNAGTFGAFGFNVDKLVVWLNHNIGVQVGESIFFCNFLHSEGANTNVQLSNQEFHILSAEIFGPRTSGTNLSITAGGNFSYIQCSMESVASAGTMLNIASNTCRDATIIVSAADGGSYNYTFTAGTRPFAAKMCDVSLNNYGTGTATLGWVGASPDFPGDTYPGKQAKMTFFSGPITIQGGIGLYSGDGVPNNAMGSNGDRYYRRDTPGTVNQKEYIKAGGTWSGLPF